MPVEVHGELGEGEGHRHRVELAQLSRSRPSPRKKVPPLVVSEPPQSSPPPRRRWGTSPGPLTKTLSGASAAEEDQRRRCLSVGHPEVPPVRGWPFHRDVASSKLMVRLAASNNQGGGLGRGESDDGRVLACADVERESMVEPDHLDAVVAPAGGDLVGVRVLERAREDPVVPVARHDVIALGVQRVEAVVAEALGSRAPDKVLTGAGAEEAVLPGAEVRPRRSRCSGWRPRCRRPGRRRPRCRRRRPPGRRGRRHLQRRRAARRGPRSRQGLPCRRGSLLHRVRRWRTARGRSRRRTTAYRRYDRARERRRDRVHGE